MTNDPAWYSPPQADSFPVNAPLDAEAIQAVPAGFGIRALGRFLDVIAVMVVAVISGAVAGICIALLGVAGVVRAGWQTRIAGGGFSASSIAISLLASTLYHAISEGYGGASMGKAVLGLRVKKVDTFEPCGLVSGLVRNLAYYIDVLFFGLVAYNAMSKSSLQQRVGDKWASTVVVRANSLPLRAQGGVAIGLMLACGAYSAVTIVGTVLRVM
jgi:uncharacterized RDD family membrane protein YckC